VTSGIRPYARCQREPRNVAREYACGPGNLAPTATCASRGWHIPRYLLAPVGARPGGVLWWRNQQLHIYMYQLMGQFVV
jgi:hypothetical protein